MAKSPTRKKALTHSYTSMILPKSLHVRLKKAAIDEGRRDHELVEDAVRNYLEAKHSQSR